MEKIKKALRKLAPKERRAVEKTVARLLSDNWQGLDIVKMKGAVGIYRVRVGQIRIIFFQHKKELNIMVIERRSEKTYKGI